ncbi:MAG: DUF309 domain-containing protein [Pseudomonadota bacterium]
MTVQKIGAILGFDPFSHRLDRNVRNTLGAALISAVLHTTPDAIDACALQWHRTTLPKACRTYLSDRLTDYRAVLADLRMTRAIAEDNTARVLWNRGLFFECHEWLEIFWHRSHPPRKTALQGWIMAAGAFSQLQSGRRSAARSLARKAAARLSATSRCLATIENLDELIHGLGADPPIATVLRLKC